MVSKLATCPRCLLVLQGLVVFVDLRAFVRIVPALVTVETNDVAQIPTEFVGRAAVLVMTGSGCQSRFD